MKSRSVVSVLAVFVMASMASGATVWNPAANGIFPPDVGNWNEPLNWTNDVPGVVDGKAVLNVFDAAEAQVTDAQITNQWVLGDNGPGGVVRVMDGGSLSGDNPVWSAVGYNDFAHVIVETGGVVNFSEHMWVAFRPDTGFFEEDRPIVDIDGGTVTVGGMFGIGWDIDPDGFFDQGIGYVNVNDGGLLALSNIHADGSRSISPGSRLNINGTGVVTLPGDFTGVIETYATNELIAGNGVDGAVQAELVVSGGPGDFDGDDDVDGNDFLKWQRDPNVGDLAADWVPNFGITGGGEMQTVVTAIPLASVASVPEPCTLTLMLVSAFVLCGTRRRDSK